METSGKGEDTETVSFQQSRFEANPISKIYSDAII